MIGVIGIWLMAMTALVYCIILHKRLEKFRERMGYELLQMRKYINENTNHRHK